jgi:hypothetical protein
VEFRRDHERRRRWGLKRRHGWKLCRSRGCSPACGELGLHEDVESVPPLIWPEGATCVRPSGRPEPEAPPVPECLVEACVPTDPAHPETTDIAARADAGPAEPSEQRSRRPVRSRRSPGVAADRRQQGRGRLVRRRQRRPACRRRLGMAILGSPRARNTRRRERPP